MEVDTLIASLQRARDITPVQAKPLMAAAAGQITEVGCWAHARRKFHDLHQASQSQTDEQAIKPIAHIDAVERQVKGLGSQERLRLRMRQVKSQPLVQALHEWLMLNP